MKAIAVLVECNEGRFYDIYLNGIKVCCMPIPKDMESIHAEFQKVESEMKSKYGVTEIADKLGYPWELLELIEDPLLQNV